LIFPEQGEHGEDTKQKRDDGEGLHVFDQVNAKMQVLNLPHSIFFILISDLLIERSYDIG
jgi:hypothetical protein